VLLSVPKPPGMTTDGRCFHARAYAGTTDSTCRRVQRRAATRLVIVITGSTPFTGEVVTEDGLVRSVER
jgi:hypothetical protein